jgi:hypothetical protein
MNAFHVCGGIFAIWALTVAFLGITRENFPASPQATRLVGAISVTLALAAIGTAVYTGATKEEKHPEGGKGESAALPFL